jgi:pimeloyl-ACP methyl ester carboxylesterase
MRMAEPKHTRVAVEGAELEVFVGGPEGPGVPLLCATHPFEPMIAGSAALLSELARARVLCINPRGVGGSSPPAHPGDTTLERIVEDLEAVRRALGLGPWVFWGMSGGSFVGQLHAARHPAALSGLILSSAGPYFRQTVGDPACVLSPFFPAWRARLATLGLLGHEAAGQDVPVDADTTEWEKVDEVGWVFRRRNGPALLVSPEEPSPQFRRILPALWAFDARGWLGSVRVPTLVMCGTADPLVPLARGRAVHEAIPGSEFLALEGVGHSPVTERPTEVAEAVQRFLAVHLTT